LFKSLVRVLAIADKEWIHIRRDLRSLVLVIVLPLLMILLFGYALSVDVKHVTLAVNDQDRTHLSRSYTEKFTHTEYFKFIKYAESNKEIDSLIDSGKITLAIVIPPNFERDFKAGKPANIQVLIDGSDSNTATIALGYLKGITFQFNKEIQTQELKKIGITEVKEPIDIRTRVWYNPEMRSKNFIIPGLIVMILAIISALITSLSISREWEMGTMETLITTPVKGYEIITGKLIPYIFIGLFNIFLALSVGYFLFDVPLNGSFFELSMISVLFLIGTSGIGLLISALTKNQLLSVQLSAFITYLPSFLISGFMFPIKNMPLLIQFVTYFIPARYLITVSKGIVQKGTAYYMLWNEIIFLAIFAFLIITINLVTFTTRLPRK
jgi:ABC-2 type transport system permease protein